MSGLTQFMHRPRRPRGCRSPDSGDAGYLQKLGFDYSICASSAPSCKVGFLNLRPRLGHFKLSIRLPDGGLGTAYLRRSGDKVQSCEPLRRRAWAFQERTLSPRIGSCFWRVRPVGVAKKTSIAGRYVVGRFQQPRLEMSAVTKAAPA
jgi:hypothetical protein